MPRPLWTAREIIELTVEAGTERRGGFNKKGEVVDVLTPVGTIQYKVVSIK